MAESSPLILIVDDEPDLRAVLDFNLRQAGFRTAHAANGLEALDSARRQRPELILLDINLPDVVGTEVCRRLRADPVTSRIPVIMLTARGGEHDRIAGLEQGADDYVTKPFSVRELMLRVEAVHRRGDSTPEPGRRLLRAGPIELDLDAMIARVDGREIALALLEFRFLAYLIEGQGKARSRDEILETVWGYASEAESRTVDTHIKRLREKLGEAGDLIETVRGIGYRVRANRG